MTEKTDTQFFKNEVKARKIERLVHFTPLRNLVGIFEQECILSRDELEKLGAESSALDLWDYISINDKIRLDNLSQFVNTSIQNINYPLLQIFRKRLSSEFPSWCVLEISVDLIWGEHTLFSIGNAASKASKHLGIDGSFEKFLRLFEYESRAHEHTEFDFSGLNQPVDVQSEVLILDKIPMTAIQKICFESEADKLTALGTARMFSSGPLPEFAVDLSMFSTQV